MRKRLAAGLLLLMLLMSGCWDRTEIEDTAYIISLGVDLAEDEYLWTFRVVESEELPIGMLTTAQKDQTQMASGLLVARGANLEQALQVIQAGVVRVLSLEHLRTVLIGEPLARQGIAPILRQLLRHSEVRRGIGFEVSRGEARPIFEANRPVGEQNPAKFMEGTLLVQKRMHLSPPIRLQHFYSRLISPGIDPMAAMLAVNEIAQQPLDAPLPPLNARTMVAGEFPRHGGNPIEVAGAAIFRQDKLVGFLPVNESIALLSLRGEMGKVYQSIPDPEQEGKFITIRFGQETKPKFTVGFEGGRPTVHIKLVFDGEIVGAPGGTSYSVPENRRKLEQFASRYGEETIYRPLIKKLYNEWGADPVGLGQLFRSRFPTFKAWLEYDWASRVRDLKVTVESDLFIRRFGLLLDEMHELKGR